MARLTTIAADIATGIGQITTAAGYGVTWGSVNQPDQALVTYPSAMIIYGGEQPIQALGLAPGATGVFRNVEFKIIIRVALSSTAAVPIYSIDAQLDTALRALSKRMAKFIDGSAPGTYLGVDAFIEFAGAEREISRSGDVYIPSDLITRWNVKYMDRD